LSDLTETFHAQPAEAGKRLDIFLVGRTSKLSRSRLKDLIESGYVLRNGQPGRPRDIVRAGDLVNLRVPPVAPQTLIAEEIAVPFLYEDDDLVVIDKPANLSVHPGSGRSSGTLVNALLFHCSNLSGIGGELRPGIVHRLDKDTSGCLVVAKNDEAHIQLSRQFATREVEKWYLALCRGLFKVKQGDISGAIARHPIHRKKMAVTSRGRTARTGFQVVAEINGASLVLCRLYTGRTHQIRVHLHHLGHHLLGDSVYGKVDPRYPRQMLHAWRLGFAHPRHGNWMKFEAPLPNDFLKAGVEPELCRSGGTEDNRPGN
jgi:23S rRNA pseudouridine1911/1915/1917 synthase